MEINWIAVLVCFVVGQVFLTLWFTIFFGDPWAKVFGVADRKEHSAQIPPYTYAIGAVSTILVVIGLALLQVRLDVSALSEGLLVGLFVALFFCVATALPGYAFLKRWAAFRIAVSSQVLMILLVSAILSMLGAG